MTYACTMLLITRRSKSWPRRTKHLLFVTSSLRNGVLSWSTLSLIIARLNWFKTGNLLYAEILIERSRKINGHIKQPPLSGFKLLLECSLFCLKTWCRCDISWVGNASSAKLLWHPQAELFSFRLGLDLTEPTGRCAEQRAHQDFFHLST